MKTFLKYITLLLVGGVIIPFYSHKVNIKQAPAKTGTQLVATGISPSVMEIAVAKLLPVVKYFR